MHSTPAHEGSSVGLANTMGININEECARKTEIYLRRMHTCARQPTRRTIRSMETRRTILPAGNHVKIHSLILFRRAREVFTCVQINPAALRVRFLIRCPGSVHPMSLTHGTLLPIFSPSSTAPTLLVPIMLMFIATGLLTLVSSQRSPRFHHGQENWHLLHVLAPASRRQGPALIAPRRP